MLFKHVYVTGLFLQLFTISWLKEPAYMTCKFSQFLENSTSSLLKERLQYKYLSGNSETHLPCPLQLLKTLPFHLKRDL